LGRSCLFGGGIAPVEITLYFLELGHRVEDVFLELQPICAFTRLAIWNPFERGAKLPPKGLNDGWGVTQGHTANKVNVPVGTCDLIVHDF